MNESSIITVILLISVMITLAASAAAAVMMSSETTITCTVPSETALREAWLDGYHTCQYYSCRETSPGWSWNYTPQYFEYVEVP